MTKVNQKVLQISDFAQWQNQIIEAFEAMNMTRSDAQGLLERHEFTEAQAWGMGLNAEDTAKKILISATPSAQFGKLAKEYVGKDIPISVLVSINGYYIGTMSGNGPCSRESVEYFMSENQADYALSVGGWTQRIKP